MKVLVININFWFRLVDCKQNSKTSHLFESWVKTTWKANKAAKAISFVHTYLWDLRNKFKKTLRLAMKILSNLIELLFFFRLSAINGSLHARHIPIASPCDFFNSHAICANLTGKRDGSDRRPKRNRREGLLPDFRTNWCAPSRSSKASFCMR